MVKKICLLLCMIFAAISMKAEALSDTINVVKADVSWRYKNAVREGFYKTLSSNSGLEPGYHGFADFGYTLGISDYDFGRFEINSSHGYQFNPYLFLGGGVGVHFMSEYETPYMDIALDYRKNQVDIPVFANVRWTVLNNRITPLADVKCGYYVTHGGGLYANISIGCRFTTYGRQAVSLSVGYTREELEFQTFDRFYSHHGMDYMRVPRKLSTEGVSVKIGYEF